MMNIQSAIRQMRVARRLGKLSLDQQNRILRRLAPRESQLNWEKMMGLRAQIEKEIQPILQARRQAERECFQVKYVATETQEQVEVAMSEDDKRFFAAYALRQRLASV